MSEPEIPIEAASSPEEAVEEAKERKAPAPNATGNSQITIFKHDLVDDNFDTLDNTQRYPAGVELAIGNVSDTTIATVVFEALFYDVEGNILDAVKHKEVDLPPNSSRGIIISSSQYDSGKVKSYGVRLIRTTTADVEKVQLRRQDIQTTETGEEAIHGIVKNISKVKTDAAVVVTFFDVNQESIGTRVVLLRDIEPGTIRHYNLRYKPQEGDTVAGCGFAIAEIAE